MIGKPNAGKSTLTNTLVGEKVSIVSWKPQTTRNKILGIMNGEDYQIVIVDTPGVHKAKNALSKYMMKSVEKGQEGSEVIVYVSAMDKKPDDTDREYIAKYAGKKTPLIIVLNKCDEVEREAIVGRINEFKDIQGVERLQSRKPLSLGTKNLTIIYGRNGSGKSGYTRLLKRICGKSVTPLKSNIYADAVSAQTCTISYKLDDREAAIEWEEGKVSETNVLENVDIFDNQSEDVYLVGEHGVDYVPREINLFRELANCYGEIRNRLAQERSNLQSKLPHMPRQYEGTTIAAEYNQLMLGTVPQKIEEFTNFTQQQANDVANLSERLTTKDPSASAKRQRDIKSKIDQLKTRVTEFALLSSPSVVADIRGLVRDARERRQQVNEGALALKEHSNLNGVGQSIWKSLWEAARRYSVEVAYQGRPFPNVDSGARCV